MRVVDLTKYRIIKQPLEVDITLGDEINVKPTLADNNAPVNIPASLTEVLLVAVNTLRREIIVHNNSNGVLYVLCGSGVTTTNYNWKLKKGDHLTIDTFRGEVNGIFTNATGFAMVNEIHYT